MEAKIDFLHVPQIIVNDALNTGNVIKGSAILTHRYFFVLADKVDGYDSSNKTMFNKDYVNAFISNPNEMDIVVFEAEMLSSIPPEFVYPVADFEMFSVQVGFGFVGGLRFRRKGGKVQSASVGKKEIRQNIKDFYADIIKK
jgi:hypothetical protein